MTFNCLASLGKIEVILVNCRIKAEMSLNN